MLLGAVECVPVVFVGAQLHDPQEQARVFVVELTRQAPEGFTQTCDCESIRCLYAIVTVEESVEGDEIGKGTSAALFICSTSQVVVLISRSSMLS